MTMRWIASSTPSSGSTMVQFTNITQEYDHLELRYSIRGSDSGTISYANIALNDDYYGPTTYSQHSIAGNGSSPFAEGYANIQSVSGLYTPGASATAGIYAVGVSQILDYKNTSKFKTLRNTHGWDGNGTTSYVMLNSGLWRSTAAVTKVALINMTFVANSRVDLYGINSNPVATGA